jgi:hypothetical protein
MQGLRPCCCHGIPGGSLGCLLFDWYQGVIQMVFELCQSM